MKSRPLAALLVAVLLCLPDAAAAHDYKVGPITITNPWARASIIDVAAAYLTLHNTGSEVDRLVSVTSPVAERVQMHTSSMEQGVARMRPVEAIEITPGKATVLKPGGVHIMLMGLKYKLEEGARVPLTLRFAKAGIVTVQADVAKAGATGPGPHKAH